MKKSNKQKDVTLNELADTIDSLAISVANGFNSVDKRFESVEKRFESVEKEIREVKDVLKKTGQDVLNIGDRFIPRHEFDTLLIRVSRLEEKVRTKK